MQVGRYMTRAAWETLVVIDAAGEACAVRTVAEMRGISVRAADLILNRLVRLALLDVNRGGSAVRRGAVRRGEYTLTDKARRRLAAEAGGLWGKPDSERSGRAKMTRKRRDTLSLVAELGGACTANEAAERLGAEPKHVSTKMRRLTNAGLLSVTRVASAGSGCPANVYALTDYARRMLETSEPEAV